MTTSITFEMACSFDDDTLRHFTIHASTREELNVCQLAWYERMKERNIWDGEIRFTFHGIPEFEEIER